MKQIPVIVGKNETIGRQLNEKYYVLCFLMNDLMQDLAVLRTDILECSNSFCKAHQQCKIASSCHDVKQTLMNLKADTMKLTNRTSILICQGLSIFQEQRALNFLVLVELGKL